MHFMTECCGIRPIPGRKSKPRYSLYEALQELVYFVYENEQGITEETYLTENGKIIFASIVNRDFVETGRL